MEEIVEALRAEQAELVSTVEPLDHDGLATPSRCPGWTVADVLLHLAQTNELAVASVHGQLEAAAAAGPEIAPVSTVDDWAEAVVAAERIDDLDGVRDRFLASAEAQVDVFANCDPRRRVLWVAGELAARTLASTRLSETWIHSGDIAWGLGAEQSHTDRLWHIARLAHRTLPYAFASSERSLTGPVRFELTAPSGEVWTFGNETATTTVRGDAAELCLVAARRVAPADTSLHGDGPDAADVLELVRTFA